MIQILKKIFGYVQRFVQEELDLRYLTFLVAFLSAGIYIWYRDDTLLNIRNEMSDDHRSFAFFFALFAIPYLTAFGGYIAIRKRWDLLRNGRFWLLTAIALGIFTARSGFTSVFIPTLDYFTANWEHPYYWFRIINEFSKFLIVMLLVTVYWWFDRKSSHNPYGFTLVNSHLKLYLFMLAVMLPFVIGFGLTDHFGASYPRVGKYGLHYFDINQAADLKYFLLYELVYGIDFISIEYFFRGFLIIAFARYVGPGAILPMASFYVFIHFGKPYVETISSFFGGTLLGILSYYSRSIWGGIVVHMGIAWLMELGAFIGKMKA